MTLRPSRMRKCANPMKRSRLKSRRKSIAAHELNHYKRVAELPCAECGIVGYSQCAHSNRYEDGKGLGIKAHYLATFPLCATRPGEIGCHAKHDQCIGMTREEADERTERYIADTHRKLGITNSQGERHEPAGN
jgi:hypothetical protein